MVALVYTAGDVFGEGTAGEELDSCTIDEETVPTFVFEVELSEDVVTGVEIEVCLVDSGEVVGALVGELEAGVEELLEIYGADETGAVGLDSGAEETG